MNTFLRNELIVLLALYLSATVGVGLAVAQDLSETVLLPGPDDAPVRFNHVTIDHGLSQMGVYAILQDRHGFMWFGTQDGLNRYDGSTFKVYQHDPNDPGSLLTYHIRALLQDRDGMLWVGHDGGGLSRFDLGTETFTHYQHDEDDPRSLSNDGIWTLYEDGQGTLWVGSRGGLDRFDPETETFTRYLPDPEEPSNGSNFVLSILEDRSGILWIGTVGGLFRYEPETNTFARSTSLGRDVISALYEDRQGTLWVGGWGLHRFDREADTAEGYLMDPQATEPALFGANRVRAIYEDDTGTLWVSGTGGYATPAGGGLNRFDRVTGTFTRYLHDPGDPSSLISNNVWSIYQDRQGILWVGTDGGGGMSRIDRTARQFSKYPLGSSDPNSLQGGAPRGMYLDRDDVLWIGTSGGVLNRFDRRSGTFTHFRHDPADPYSLLPGATFDILRDRQGRLWVGSFGGLSRFDDETGHFTHFRHDPNDVTSIASSRVDVIYEDRSGQLWIGTFEGGLNRFNTADETFTRYVHDPDDANSINGRFPSTLYEDHAGQLWIGTWDGGLNRFNAANETFTHYLHDPDDTQSLSNDTVFGLYERPQEPGILWVATSQGGLDRLDVQTGRFTHFTSQNSDLPNNTVYAVFGDEEGHLWMSTNNGISRFHPDTETFKNFKTENGLQMLEFDVYAFHQGYNGEMFFGGAGGVNAIRPGDVFANPNPPEVALSGLRLFNEPITPGPASALQVSITETEAVSFSHGQNDLTLEYVGLHFANPAHNQYKYRLEGYDDDWREVGTERRAIYTNLPPDDYTFHVMAANSDGVWSEEGASLAITILPPWWRTWWAYGLYGMLFLGGVFAVDRFQRRRLIARERERARERELEQAREIERAYNELRTTKDRLVQQEKMASLGQLTAGIAHEIKNPLNFVNNFASLSRELVAELRGETDPDEIQAILADLELNTTKIEEHGQRADGIVRSMMQHARAGSGEREAIDLNALVSEHIALAYHGKRAQVPDFNAEIEQDLGTDVGKVEVVPQDLGRVLLNLLGNAFDAVRERAAQVNGQYAPKVEVSTRRVGDQVEIRVTDNGPGIPADVLDKIFDPFFTTKPTGSGTGLGLSLSYDIITQGHGGTLTVESEAGEGAAFIIRIPGSIG